MTVGVGERQIIIHRVLRADRVKRLCAGGAVVPGEGEHRPAVMEVNRENEVVPMDPVHHGGHLRLPVLHRELGAEVAPVRKPTVQVLVPYTSTWYCKYQKTLGQASHTITMLLRCALSFALLRVLATQPSGLRDGARWISTAPSSSVISGQSNHNLSPVCRRLGNWGNSPVKLTRISEIIEIITNFSNSRMSSVSIGIFFHRLEKSTQTRNHVEIEPTATRIM